MSINIPSILCLLLLIYAFFKPTKYLLISAFALMTFGSLAILPPELTGGISLVVGSVAFMFLILKVLVQPKGLPHLFRNILSLKYLGLLTLFTIVGIAGAFILPKIFIGQVYVVALRPTTGLFVMAEPLQPTNGNITQSAYIFISFMSAAIFADLVKMKNFVADFGTAVVVGTAFVVASGLLDMGTSMVGLGDTLSIFRNASYAFLTEGTISGVRRVVGLMPEASAFGAWAVTCFALMLFGRNMFTTKQRTRIVMPLALVCAGLAAISTSSTAYVSLAVVVIIYFWDALSRLNLGSPEEKKQTLGEFTAIAGLALVGTIVVLSFDETRNTLFTLIDTMVFKKTESSSFTERTSWNDQALQAFAGTHGLGVGLGGVRTSNFFVNILACTGIIGALFFGAFLLKIVFVKCKSEDPELRELVRAAKLTLAPIFVIQLLVGTIPDYGVVTGALFGIIIGGSYAVKKKMSLHTLNSPLEFIEPYTSKPDDLAS